MTVDYDNGCAPISINMKDASDGATGYILDLGDGSSPAISLHHPLTLHITITIIQMLLLITYLPIRVSNDDGCNDFYTDTIRDLS